MPTWLSPGSDWQRAVTGSAPARVGAAGADMRQTGMTLVEMLVVLAIVAVMASMLVLAIGSGTGRTGQVEAMRLQSRLQLAADRTMIDDEAIALLSEPHAYSFARWDAKQRQWTPGPTAALARKQELPRGMTLSVTDARRVLPLGAYGGGAGFELRLSDRERSWSVVFDGMNARLQPAADARSNGT